MELNYIKCDHCGGIIGMYNRQVFTCEKCGKQFLLYSCDYDQLMINDKTGWIFPVLYKEVRS